MLPGFDKKPIAHDKALAARAAVEDFLTPQFPRAGFARRFTGLGLGGTRDGSSERRIKWRNAIIAPITSSTPAGTHMMSPPRLWSSVAGTDVNARPQSEKIG